MAQKPERPPAHDPNKMVSKRSQPIGGYILREEPIELNAGRPTVKITVRNTGDRPIQVGSHFHFFEVNRALEFDRKEAFGFRLDIPSGTAVRFEPGDQKEVQLVQLGGKQFVNGFNNLVDGWTGTGPTPHFRPNFTKAVEEVKKRGFRDAPAGPASPAASAEGQKPAGQRDKK